MPIDFSPSSEAALEAATGLAQQFHAGIHLVHIIPEIPDFNGSDFFPETAVLQERKETIEEKLNARKEQLMLNGVPTSFSIETGNDIVGSLMRVIKREKTDMVVISTHGMSGWHPLIFGSIAQQVIKQVNCTLLLLQSSEHRPAAEEPAIDVWDRGPGKAEEGKERYVPMAPELAAEIRRYPAAIDEERIFPPKGEPKSKRQRLEGSFDDLLKRAKIRDFVVLRSASQADAHFQPQSRLKTSLTIYCQSRIIANEIGLLQAHKCAWFFLSTDAANRTEHCSIVKTIGSRSIVNASHSPRRNHGCRD